MNSADTVGGPDTATVRRAVAEAYGEPADVVRVVTAELSGPGAGQVLVEATAIATNPIDAKVIRGVMGTDPEALPIAPGRELAGVVRAVGDGVDDLGVGDEVIVYPTSGALADQVIVDAASVRRKPSGLDAEHAAGLLLVGVTAADMIVAAGVTAGETIVVHGGAGAVGVIAVQRAVQAGATVIATASPVNHEHLRALGATPVTYGDGLQERIEQAATAPIAAALDTVGTDEAIDVSLALVADRKRIVSISAFGRADDGIVIVSGGDPDSQRRRTEAIPGLIADATDGTLVTEIAGTYPLEESGQALTDLMTSHPRGKYLVLP